MKIFVDVNVFIDIQRWEKRGLHFCFNSSYNILLEKEDNF